MKASFIYHYDRQAGFYAPIAGLWYFTASLSRVVRSGQPTVIAYDEPPFSKPEGMRR